MLKHNYINNVCCIFSIPVAMYVCTCLLRYNLIARTNLTGENS